MTNSDLELAPLVVLCRVPVSIPHPHTPHGPVLVCHLDLGDLADDVHHLVVGLCVQLVPDVLTEHQEGRVVAGGLGVVWEGHGVVRRRVREDGAHRGSHAGAINWSASPSWVTYLLSRAPCQSVVSAGVYIFWSCDELNVSCISCVPRSRVSPPWPL